MRITFAVLALIPTLTYAWGPDGQQVTVRIAENYLTPKANQKIQSLFGKEKLSQFAVWADAARNQQEWSHTGPWHYINVNKSTAPQDILEALTYCREQFDRSEGDEKKTWLKFIVHLVGDLHQPLHTGRGDDRGGNSTMVKFQGREVNLHALWDSQILRTLRTNPEQLTVKLLAKIGDTSLLRSPFEAQDAVRENQEYLPEIYSYRRGEIDQSYLNKSLPITEDRLIKGGLRLAALLNEMLD